jgi:hypothetical protein
VSILAAPPVLSTEKGQLWQPHTRLMSERPCFQGLSE